MPPAGELTIQVEVRTPGPIPERHVRMLQRAPKWLVRLYAALYLWRVKMRICIPGQNWERPFRLKREKP